MKKIVILGCENSHADTFLKFIKEDEKYNDVEVLGVYSDEAEPVKKLQDKFGVPALKSFDEGVGKVDGVIITARHGANHYKYAKPYIVSGVPMFIDKPVTITAEEAEKFMAELKENGVKITGGSSCKHDAFVQQLKKEAVEKVGGETVGGFIRCPIDFGSPYGGFYFYAQHLVEIVCEIYGRYPLAVSATPCGNKTTVTFRYGDFDITGLTIERNYVYFAARMSESGVNASEMVIDGDNPCFKKEFDEFYELLNGGEQKISYKDFISPVYIMNAIERAIKSGKEEKVSYKL